MFTGGSRELLVAWKLLRIFESRRKYCNSSKPLIAFIDYDFVVSGIMNRRDVAFILQSFLSRGIIHKLCIAKEEFMDGVTSPRLIENVCFTAEEIVKKEDEELFFDMMPEYSVIKEYVLWEFEVELDKSKCNKFISGYFSNWKDNIVNFSKRNLLQSRKQVGKLVYNIMKLLEDYSPSNLLLEYSYRMYEEMDFFATLFFLEDIQDIEIVNLLLDDQGMVIRVNVKDKFYKDFPYDRQFPLLESMVVNGIDLDKITGNESCKAIAEKIFLKAPKLLAYKGFEYGIKENKIPYHLLYLAREKKGIVDQSELRKVTGETQARIKKALDNLRKGLRKKFEFPASEIFFEPKGGLIQFKEELFDFS